MSYIEAPNYCNFYFKNPYQINDIFEPRQPYPDHFTNCLTTSKNKVLGSFEEIFVSQEKQKLILKNGIISISIKMLKEFIKDLIIYIDIPDSIIMSRNKENQWENENTSQIIKDLKCKKTLAIELLNVNYDSITLNHNEKDRNYVSLEAGYSKYYIKDEKLIDTFAGKSIIRRNYKDKKIIGFMKVYPSILDCPSINYQSEKMTLLNLRDTKELIKPVLKKTVNIKLK